MSVLESINPALLKEASDLAKRRQVPPSTVIEEALEQYLHAQPMSSPRGSSNQLPVAQVLRFKSDEVGTMSLGKLLESAENDADTER